MTYDQYWRSNYWVEWAFLEAEKLRQKRLNETAWLNGLYVYDAVSVSLANAFRKSGSPEVKYPGEPYEFAKEKTQKEIEDQEERDRIIAKLYMQNMARVGKNWGKKQ
jgi:hypothetical protein